MLGCDADAASFMIVWPRLLIGFVVLISTEMFSGASVTSGLWSPWTWIMTFWLYFAHFFFFTTLAVRTGRTSLGSLYLWGVLFGLYESWITKVIWHGYSGDGKFVLGSIGPYGFSEISMAFLFHPVMAFILPLAVACLLCPPLRRLFPDLAWFTGTSRWARLMRVYVVISFGATLGMNSGGPVNLVLNVAFVVILLVVLWRLARSGLAAADGWPLVVFGRRGFIGLCLYLVLLYGVTYVYLRPDGLPSPAVQLLTLVFYAACLLGLKLGRRRAVRTDAMPEIEPAELRRVGVVFVSVLGLSLLLSFSVLKPAVYRLVVANFIVWTPLGFFLTALALARGWREWRVRRAECTPVRSCTAEESPLA